MKIKSHGELKAAVLADGLIDDYEVAAIENAIWADGRIDQTDADLIFDLNDATVGKANSHNWQPLFIQALTAFVLEDNQTPGTIDDEEASYIASRIKTDDFVDPNEAMLLHHLKTVSSNFPDKLAALLQPSD